MAGFGSIGGLGGRPGGFGASYPSRSGAPNSQTVDYLRPQDEWQSDFDSRWAAEQARGRAPAFLGGQETMEMGGPPTVYGYGAGPAAPGPDGGFSSAPLGVGAPASAPTVYAPGTGPTAPGPGPVAEQPLWDGGYTPDFSALNAEREQMMGRYDAQGRNQQAYDIMNGGNQINGIIGPEYTNPNFGRITGAQPQGPKPEDMQWADGLYNATGTYATTPGRTGGWSLW